MFQGLRTVIYHAPDLAAAKEWYARALGVQPYFDQPFYVGFNVAGYELGLDPDPSSATGTGNSAVAYWGVADAAAALARLVELGATDRLGVQDVGGDIRVASVLDPFGNVFGIIENPHFSLENA
ncbi:MAG TPA: VOC family protein [Roseiflexaceae bacterium]|nr:VOC family protein [Roseiflexaceae bacterium]